jgi:hypothetical protein
MVFFKKEIIENTLISQRYDFLKIMTFFDFCHIFKRIAKIKKKSQISKNHISVKLKSFSIISSF